MPGQREEPRQLQAESLFAAWASRVEAGEGLDFEELVRANTELEPELRALHEDWKHFAPILGNVVPGLIASGDGLVLPSLTRGPDVDEGPPSDELLEKLGLHAPDTKRYRFRGRIGTGGQGVVLKVWDAKLSRPLAMKIVLGRAEDQPTGQTPRVDGRRLTRFVDEARIASQLNHPGIVPVHELGADESGRAFFTMKLVKGDDLSRIFEKVKRGEDGIGLPRAVSYLLRVCEAMAYAHDRGVIHRDLKPANVMVGAYGEVHVMDWGLARVIGDAASDASAPRARSNEPISHIDSVRRAERETTPGSVLATEHGDWIGTPCYMSPEQARGDNAVVGPQSDVYAVGAMLYQLLTWTPPYVPPGETVSGLIVLRQTIHGPPPPVESLAPRAIPELVAICERAMARDPAARYASMRALAADLQAFLDGHVVSAYEAGTWAETRKWVKRNRALTAAVLATVSTTALGAIISVWLVNDRSAEAHRANENAARLAATTNLAAIRTAELALKLNNPALARRVLDTAPSKQRNWEWQFLTAQSDTSILTELAAIGYAPHMNFAAESPTLAVEVEDERTRVITLSGGSVLEVDGRFPSGSAPLNSTASQLAVLRSEIDTAADSASSLHLDVWSVAARELLWSSSTKQLRGIHFSDDDATIVAETEDGILAWDAATGSSSATSQLRQPGGSRAEFEAPRAEIEHSWRDSVVRVRTPSNDGAPPIAELVGHTTPPKSVALSTDGRLAASCSDDGSIRIWDATDLRTRLGSIDLDQNSFALRFSGDERRLLVGCESGLVQVYDASDNSVLMTLRGHSNTVKTIVISPDGRLILTAAGDEAARLWDYATGRLLAELANGGQVWSARFDASGKKVMTTSWGSDPAIWELVGDSARRVHSLAGHTEQVNSGDWSSDGHRVATASSDRTGRLWDADSGRCVSVLRGHTDPVWHVVFVDGGRLLVTASEDSIRIWNSLTGEPVRVLEASPTAPIETVWFSSPVARTASGSHLAVAFKDSSVRVFDVKSGTQVAKLDCHAFSPSHVLFMDDDRRLATASYDGRVKVWDWINGFELLEFDGHSENVTAIGISPTSRHLVTTAMDRSIRVWSTVPHRDRFWEHRTRSEAAESAEELVSTALARTSSWGAAWELLTDSDTSADAATRSAAMARFSVRAQRAAQKLDVAKLLQAERAWVRRVLGYEPWSNARAVLESLSAESFPIGDADACIAEAERILNDLPNESEAEMRALVLAQLAVDHHAATSSGRSTKELMCSLVVLGRAKCQVGQFAEAQDALRRVLESGHESDGQLRSRWTPDSWPAWLRQRGAWVLRSCPLCGGPPHSKTQELYFEALVADIDALQDDRGRPCDDVWRQRDSELEREIAEIEADPDVQIWLREKR